MEWASAAPRWGGEELIAVPCAAEQPAFQGYGIWGGSGSCLPTDGFARFCLWIQHRDDKERGVLESSIPGHFH